MIWILVQNAHNILELGNTGKILFMAPSFVFWLFSFNCTLQLDLVWVLEHEIFHRYKERTFSLPFASFVKEIFLLFFTLPKSSMTILNDFVQFYLICFAMKIQKITEYGHLRQEDNSDGESKNHSHQNLSQSHQLELVVERRKRERQLRVILANELPANIVQQHISR